METSRVEDLIDRLYVKIELLESRIGIVMKGDERALTPILDIINQIYDLLAELRRGVRSRCS